MVPKARCLVMSLSNAFNELLRNDAKHRSHYQCFFMYSNSAFSSSSLTLRADPVLLTTNLIHCCQVPLSMFIEVLAFSLCWLNIHQVPLMVNKDNGNYHKLNIETHGNMVMWYNGNTKLHKHCTSRPGESYT
jgi:hypothetical protein